MADDRRPRIVMAFHELRTIRNQLSAIALENLDEVDALYICQTLGLEIQDLLDLARMIAKRHLEGK